MHQTLSAYVARSRESELESQAHHPAALLAHELELARRRTPGRRRRRGAR